MWIFQQHHQQLEQLPLPQRRIASLSFPWFWQSFLGFWHLSSKDIQVQERTDRTGNVYWQVDDLANAVTLQFTDELDLLMWLDEQHYHRARPTPWTIG